MRGQSIISPVATQPGNRAAAAGPITVIRYRNGKPWKTEVLPAPGDVEYQPPKLQRIPSYSHRTQLDDSLVSKATFARRIK